ncbi:MAG TPA: GAF domain-containing protein [Coleofasciculaceae cyanobacterium]
MFSIIKSAFQLLPAWIEYPRWQAALTKKIVDRIRNSLELQVVLQTAVDEVAALLKLDSCIFLWYFEDTQRLRVVCEHNSSSQNVSYLGYHPFKSISGISPTLTAGRPIIVNSELVPSWRLKLGQLVQRFPWLRTRFPQVWQSGNSYQANHQLFGYRASLLIPVTRREDRVGFIACLSELPRLWLPAEIQFLESIAEPLDVAICQAKLYEQTQKQAIRERLVNQITHQTRQSFEPETILKEAIAQLLESLQADQCWVHLVEDPNYPEDITAKFSNETPPPQQSYEVSRPPFASAMDDLEIQEPITQWVIQHRTRVMIPDITQDKRLSAVRHKYSNTQIKSSLIVPVQANGKLHALLYLNQCSHSRYWSNNDQELVQAVADQLAISLQQAYLYARTQQQASHSAMQAQKLAEMLAELRLTQAQLIESEKISSLGRMVAGVAHEINNPVSFIYGNIPYIQSYVNDLVRLVQAYQAHCPHRPSAVQQLVEETDIEFLTQDLPKILKSMKSGAERIQGVVEVLQKFAGSNFASFKPIDLNAALESTLLIVYNPIASMIKVERHYDRLPPVECYPKEINQAILSILTNAIEALNRSNTPNKVIKLQTQWLSPQEAGGEGRVRIVIADNGSGIKPDIQPRIFEPFFTTKDVGQGRGLGLTVTYQTIVNQHKGQLEVKSKVGWGTECVIEIPIRHSDSSVSEPLPSQPRATASASPLIVNPSPVNSCCKQ